MYFKQPAVFLPCFAFVLFLFTIGCDNRPSNRTLDTPEENDSLTISPPKKNTQVLIKVKTELADEVVKDSTKLNEMLEIYSTIGDTTKFGNDHAKHISEVFKDKSITWKIEPENEQLNHKVQLLDIKNKKREDFKILKKNGLDKYNDSITAKIKKNVDTTARDKYNIQFTVTHIQGKTDTFTLDPILRMQRSTE